MYRYSKSFLQKLVVVSVPSSSVDSVKSAVKQSHLVPVDQYSGQEFFRNDAGWCRNTISSLARCETLEQYKMLASRLVKSDVKTDGLQDLSIDERFKLIRPRSCQLPCEVNVYAETIASIDADHLRVAYSNATVSPSGSSDFGSSDPGFSDPGSSRS